MPHNGRVRILFAGGCHLTGYPVGEEYAYQHVSVRQLQSKNIECDIQYLEHVPLHHAHRVVEACARFRPDVLILQVTHFELNTPLAVYIASRLGMAKPKLSSRRMGDVPERSRRFYLVRSGMKAVVDRCLGRPLVDFGTFESRLEQFLHAIDECRVENVIFLSPLPCLDTMCHFYRRQGLPIIEKVVARHRCTYLDVTGMEPLSSDPQVGKHHFYADGIHLGSAGQSILGRLLAEKLVATLNAQQIESTLHAVGSKR